MASRGPSAQTIQNLRLIQQLRQHDVHLKHQHTVTWNHHSKDHPRYWSPWRKYYTTVVISWLEMFMTALSSSGAAASDAAQPHLGYDKTFGYFCFITVYLLGQAVAGIVCSPISEAFGRRTLYVVSTFAFCVLSAIIAAAPHVVVITIARFLQGASASIPATVAFGNFEDMFDTETRIWIVYGYTIAGMIGLVGGPIYSAYIVKVLSWRWVFGISAAIGGISAVLCLAIRESKASQLLQDKVDHLREETGRFSLYADVRDDRRPSIMDFVTRSLFRPVKFLLTEPLVMFCSVLCAIAFGTVYGLTEAITIVYTTPPFSDTFDTTSSSLAFLALLIGEVLDVLPRIYDYRLLRSSEGNPRQHIRPESKITSFALACPALAIGLWLFAWTIPPRVTHVPWPVSMIGLILIGFSINDFSYVLFGYITDSYGSEYAASSVSAVSLSRTLTAAIFPLFTTQMFKGLDNNIAISMLAGVATLFLFTPFLFLRYGESLRGKSKTALSNEAFEMADIDDEEDCAVAQARDSALSAYTVTDEEKALSRDIARIPFTNPWENALAAASPRNQFQFERQRISARHSLALSQRKQAKRHHLQQQQRHEQLISPRQRPSEMLPDGEDGDPDRTSILRRDFAPYHYLHHHHTFPVYRREPRDRYRDNPLEASTLESSSLVSSSSSSSSSSSATASSSSSSSSSSTTEATQDDEEYHHLGRQSVVKDFI